MTEMDVVTAHSKLYVALNREASDYMEDVINDVGREYPSITVSKRAILQSFILLCREHQNSQVPFAEVLEQLPDMIIEQVIASEAAKTAGMEAGRRAGRATIGVNRWKKTDNLDNA